ncbi:hypothetical protein SKAU_G00122330 [Synaphobranchus kaupii]|uniref:Uncharacterized protein n=1 Tax=Synaphobranchus kaupii TaxID=118154 RepID=A0A9Q1FPP3_SYNKA|nr:hypothetical protein SKAU_G00122330 [Synaphobranchus kaupii]
MPHASHVQNRADENAAKSDGRDQLQGTWESAGAVPETPTNSGADGACISCCSDAQCFACSRDWADLPSDNRSGSGRAWVLAEAAHPAQGSTRVIKGGRLGGGE